MIEIDLDNVPDTDLPSIGELTGDMRLLAETVGVRAAFKISMVFNGIYVRVWGWKRLKRELLRKRMRDEYDRGGITGVELFRKYGISERWGWELLGRTGTSGNRKM
jgi:hypothetical protein